MTKDMLKEKVIQEIEKNKEHIKNIGRNIYNHPELGYKEYRTTEIISNELDALGLKVDRNIAITGCRGCSNIEKEGPKIAVLGELDSVICFDHPDADKVTGAIHACGHNIQVSVMVAVAIGLIKSGVIKELDGKVDFMAVPSEEYIEMEFRNKLKKEGKLKYFGGKQELIYKGAFDDVDMSMMIHSLALDLEDKYMIVNPTGNGFIGKNIDFIGKEAHAGGEPENGINALNMAMLAINSMHVQRETFRDEDKVRVHQIITKGGDIVNVVPADVKMETCVRAKTIEAMLDANEKIDKSAIGAANILGGKVKISDMPGYLPLYTDKNLNYLFKENALMLVDGNKILDKQEFTGSFDFGDISHIMPVLHPFIGGVQGGLHSRDYKIIDEDIAYILPAKSLALTIIDILYDKAKVGKKILKEFVPKMKKEEYLRYLKDNEKTCLY